jgi:hypothetical protein
MDMVTLTREYRQAAVLILSLPLLACGTDSIAGPEPVDASMAKGSAGRGQLHWNTSGTYYDFAANTFHYKIGGSPWEPMNFTITVTAEVTASYGCASSDDSIVVPDAFQGATETISASTAVQVLGNGKAAGSLQLSLNDLGALSCGDGLEATNVSLGSTNSVRVTVNPGFLPPLTF